MAVQTCGLCRYWYVTDRGADDQRCRRFPPTFASEFFKERPYPHPAAGVWPVTAYDDWCGEWAAKDD